MTKSEAQVQFPQEVEKINNSSMYHDVIDSEDYFSFKERVVSCFIDLLSNVKDETIAIVTHG
jgi:broad specificity phosphatase PhoE